MKAVHLRISSAINKKIISYITFLFLIVTPVFLMSRNQSMLIRVYMFNTSTWIWILHEIKSNLTERKFPQCRQITGGRFLVIPREVLNSESILKCNSLIKAHINFWENLKKEDSAPEILFFFLIIWLQTVLRS